MELIFSQYSETRQHRPIHEQRLPPVRAPDLLLFTIWILQRQPFSLLPHSKTFADG